MAGHMAPVAQVTKSANYAVNLISRLLANDAGKALPLWQVGLTTVVEIAFFIAASRMIVTLIRAAAARADMVLEQRDQSTVNLQYAATHAALHALQGPCAFFLPLAAVLLSIHVGADFMEDVLVVKEDALSNLPTGGIAIKTLAAALNNIDLLAMRLSSVFLLALGVWCLIDWKDKVVDIITTRSHYNASRLTEVDKLLRPISQVGTWVMITGASFAGLNILGIDITPLLNVAGVSGLAIGFGAQSVTASVISGLNLFLTRPFVVGERVMVDNMFGAVVAHGVVESINPMRTIIRNQQNHPIAVPNKSLTEMVIINQSRVDAPAESLKPVDPAVLCSEIGIKYKDVDMIPVVQSKIQHFLANYVDIDQGLPHSCSLESMQEDATASFKIIAHTKAAMGPTMDDVRLALMINLSKIVRQAGCEFNYAKAV